MSAFTDSLRGLVNSLSGLGGGRDKGAQGNWFFTPLSREQLVSAYRSNWMVRKAVDIPVFDSLRAGWTWEVEDGDADKIEEAEAEFRVTDKIRLAMTKARLFGGAGIIIGDGASDPMEPLDIDRITAGGLQYLTVMDRQYLSAGEIEQDPQSQGYGEPTYYEVSSASGAGGTRLHPSRVVRFIGAETPDPMVDDTAGWGDSVLDAIEIAIRDATAGQQGIANLIQEASVDIIKIPSLTQNIATAKYRDAILERVSLMARGKSLINAALLDKDEEWTQKTANFSQLPEVQRLMLQIVSGAADIPATRFLGQSPAGLSATGESDMRNYYDRVQAEQEMRLRPKLERILGAVVRSSLGSMPEGAGFNFKSLWQMTEKEAAEIGKMEAEEDEKLAMSGLVPIEVLEEGTRGRLIERGRHPGIAQAYEEYDKRDPEEGDELTDASPRTLYVHRPVLNGSVILEWARSQGFRSTLDSDDLHVTIAFSRTPVDWMAMGQPWESEITIPEGGPRLVETLGPKGAVVLLIASSHLSWRHEEMKRAGASWDWPEYQPHITITYEGNGGDLKGVEPYQGEIVLGPEVFAEVVEDWEKGRG